MAYQPLPLSLEDESIDGDRYSEKSSWDTRPLFVRTRTQAYLTTIQLLVFGVNIALCVWLILLLQDRSVASDKIPDLFTPAVSAVGYRLESAASIQDYESSPFIGEPRPELDKAWSDLIGPLTLRVSEEEMFQMNRTSLALKDGSGYVGMLEVHHMLHCLKRMKQFRHRDHYPEVGEEHWSLHHWDHCVEVLRRGIMCNADLMISTMVWEEDRSIPDGDNHWPRKCRDWDSIQSFADSRAVRLNDDTLWPKDSERTRGPAGLLVGQEHEQVSTWAKSWKS